MLTASINIHATKDATRWSMAIIIKDKTVK
jgi:hypothetical protein